MAQKYPLYDELKEKVFSRKDKTIDVNLISSTINNICKKSSEAETAEHYMEIQALIMHHDIVTNSGVLLTSVPYEGKVMFSGRGILYTFTNLPPILQQIIAQYIEDYSK